VKEKKAVIPNVRGFPTYLAFVRIINTGFLRHIANQTRPLFCSLLLGDAWRTNIITQHSSNNADHIRTLLDRNSESNSSPLVELDGLIENANLDMSTRV
jgi:hypothetical protein